MLKAIKVSGFKSLDGFELEFQPGLNVLIGPNGSGKTNIINFLEFLSFLSRGSLLDAVGRSGGAGTIFRRQNSGKLERHINFRVQGEGTYREIRSAIRSEIRSEIRSQTADLIVYEYEAKILLANNNSSIVFDQQRVKMRRREGDALEPAEPIWGLDIEIVSTSGQKNSFDVRFHELDEYFVAERLSVRKRAGIEALRDVIEDHVQE